MVEDGLRHAFAVEVSCDDRIPRRAGRRPSVVQGHVGHVAGDAHGAVAPPVQAHALHAGVNANRRYDQALRLVVCAVRGARTARYYLCGHRGSSGKNCNLVLRRRCLRGYLPGLYKRRKACNKQTYAKRQESSFLTREGYEMIGAHFLESAASSREAARLSGCIPRPC